MVRALVPALVLAALAASAARAAAPQPTFGLRAAGNPQAGYFVYTTGAGTTKHGVVIVSNSGKAAGTVTLSTAAGSTGTTTGAIYLTNRAAGGSAAWVRLSRTKIAIAPKTAVRVPFTVAVPAGTAAGQYVAGIVAAGNNQPVGSSGGKTSVRIKIRNLAIMAVQVNVPGPAVHRFAVGAVNVGGTRGYQQVLVRIANSGNVLEHPTGSVTIFDSAGKRVETVPYTMDTFLPRTAIDYPVTLKKALPPGDYTAAVTISYGGNKTTRAKPAFTVTKQDVQQVFTSTTPTQAPPTTTAGGGSSGGGSKTWLWIVIAAVVALALLGGLLLWRRRRTPPAAPAATCDPYHYWVVDHDAGVTGSDGVTRFPHRCRDCGLQVVARDVTEATEFAAAMRRA
jgi:LPXTG-motif cell wall-anchored protein